MSQIPLPQLIRENLDWYRWRQNIINLHTNYRETIVRNERLDSWFGFSEKSETFYWYRPYYIMRPVNRSIGLRKGNNGSIFGQDAHGKRQQLPNTFYYSSGMTYPYGYKME